MTKRRFLFCRSVLEANGSQTYYVDADTPEEAAKLLKETGGELYAEEVEVYALSEPEAAGETTTDDFGDFPPAP